MFTTILALTGMLSGLGALALGGYALSRTRTDHSESRKVTRRAEEADASGVDPLSVRDVALLHYDALEGMSGGRSFSLALLNCNGDGVVLTSINGRTETRTYAKPVVRGVSEHGLSPEEYKVVRSARLGEGIGATSTNEDVPIRSRRPSSTDEGTGTATGVDDTGPEEDTDDGTERATEAEDAEVSSPSENTPGDEGPESFVSVIQGPGKDEPDEPDEEVPEAGDVGTDASTGRPTG